jgi:hypothetical protein
MWERLAIEATITAYSIVVGLPLAAGVIRMFTYKPPWEREGIAPCCGKPYKECSLSYWG